MTLTASPVGLQRIYHQRISGAAFTNAGAVAAWLGAAQGQDYLGTKWAFGLRLPGSTEADIDRAIAERRIVRTWALRGTLHVVAPADLHWLLGLIGPRLIAGNAGRYRQLELDEDTLMRSTSLIAAALRDGQELTRSELFALLQTSGISTAGQRGVYMLQRAALERLIAQGAMRGSETTFWALAAGDTLPPDAAAAELARRYFVSHGPATVADFVNWSGLTLTAARAALNAVKSKLADDTISNQTYWRSPEAATAPERRVYLLPGFDEFVLGYKDRSAVLDAANADAICPGGNGMFMPTVVSDGRIIGTWKRTLKAKTVEISLTLFRLLNPDERDALAAAATHYGAFVGRTAVILGVD